MINLKRTSDKKGVARVVTVVLMGLIFAVMLAAGASAAPKERYSDGGPDPKGNVITRGSHGGSHDVLGGAEGSALPFTGADITLFIATGLAAIGTGLFIVRRSRTQEDFS